MLFRSEKWGFSNDWLAANAPRVIRCSITGYGANGPKGGLPGYDFILQAESGLMSITGAKEGDPAKHGVALVDVCTGMLASNSILGALQARHRTGRGQHVEVSLYESSLFMLANVGANYLAAGRDGGRFGNGHPSIVPYTTYPTRDGMMAVAVGNDGVVATRDPAGAWKTPMTPLIACAARCTSRQFFSDSAPERSANSSGKSPSRQSAIRPSSVRRDRFTLRTRRSAWNGCVSPFRTSVISGGGCTTDFDAARRPGTTSSIAASSSCSRTGFAR